MKIGEITDINQYWYMLDSSKVSFHTAFNKDKKPITFISPEKVWASITAQNLGINYEFLNNATLEEIQSYVTANNCDINVLCEGGEHYLRNSRL